MPIGRRLSILCCLGVVGLASSAILPSFVTPLVPAEYELIGAPVVAPHDVILHADAGRVSTLPKVMPEVRHHDSTQTDASPVQLSGFVVSSITNEPASGALVVGVPRQHRSAVERMICEGRSAGLASLARTLCFPDECATEVDASGHFTIGLPSPACELLIAAPGFATQLFDTADLSEAEAALRLTPSTSVFGGVRMSGEPVEDARLSLRALGGAYLVGHCDDAFTTLSSSRGEFRLSDVPLGPYQLGVFIGQDRVATSSVWALSPTEPELEAYFDVEEHALRVLDSFGLPISGAEVAVFCSPATDSGGRSAEASVRELSRCLAAHEERPWCATQRITSDADGEVRWLGDRTSSSWSVLASASGYATVAAPVGAVSETIILPSAKTLRVDVVDARSRLPLAGARLELRRFGDMCARASVVNRAAGVFEVSDPGPHGDVADGDQALFEIELRQIPAFLIERFDGQAELQEKDRPISRIVFVDACLFRTARDA